MPGTFSEHINQSESKHVGGVLTAPHSERAADYQDSEHTQRQGREDARASPGGGHGVGRGLAILFIQARFRQGCRGGKRPADPTGLRRDALLLFFTTSAGSASLCGGGLPYSWSFTRSLLWRLVALSLSCCAR